MHPWIPLAFLAARAHCWLMVNLSSTRTPRSLSAELLSGRSTPSLYWCMGLFLPRCRTLHLPLLNLIRFLSAQMSWNLDPWRYSKAIWSWATGYRWPFFSRGKLVKMLSRCPVPRQQFCESVKNYVSNFSKNVFRDEPLPFFLSYLVHLFLLSSVKSSKPF